MKAAQISAFQNYILRWYALHGRTELPWRQTQDPYKILVSELMLQQTQVQRVIPKYSNFLRQFPDIQTLAESSLANVLAHWQGLGYNRRAKFLWQTAQKVTVAFDGRFPKTKEALQTLPGIGPYTASAVSVFAFNNPETVIETNIRTIFLYHFFPNTSEISDAQILPLITETRYTKNPREWYAALMDYGSYLKKIVPNPSRKSKHHTTQSRFEGSPRQVRGEIIRYLTKSGSLNEKNLQAKIKGNKNHYPQALQDLLKEGMITQSNAIISLMK